MKKKGLIVATIVMVLVLAVSLSTATYAWFSSQAQATVEDLTIAVQAATGVEIAVYETGDKYYNGDMNYTDNVWSSDTEGFGTLLNFNSVELGYINNAILYSNSTNLAKVPTSAQFVYTVVTKDAGATLDTNTYVINANGSITACTAEQTAEADTVYATRTALTADNKFYRPTGLDNAGDPYGFYAAKPNDKQENVYTTYYDIPLAMRSVKATKGIVCTLKIKPNAEAGSSTLYPGMAASTFVNMYIDNGSSEQLVKTFAAYESAVYANGAITGAVENEGAFSFVVAKGSITTSDVYKIRFEIWVEGTDNECNNTTTQATNFTVDYSFDVCDDEITGTSVEVNGTTYQVVANLTQTKA